MSVSPTENQEQIDFWNGPTAQAWVESQARMERLLAELSARALNRAAPRSGEQVLDIGCGCGDTTLAMAELGARVTGVDVSVPMLELARKRSASRDDVIFIEADASSHAFDRPYDLAFSRFGVMFFADPYQAFAHIRTALTPQGRLCFICWQSPRDNPWLSVPGAAAQPFLPEPEAPPDPRAPGPFAFADPDYVNDILGRAGFAHIEIEPCTTEMDLGRDVDEALHFLMRNGPMSRVLAELDEDTRTRALAAVRLELSPHAGERGVALGGACWIVRAERG
jgi:SAM-dependent methyltransferase